MTRAAFWEAFPTGLQAALPAVERGLSAASHATTEQLINDSYSRRWGDLLLDGEKLCIPYRHYQLPVGDLASGVEPVRQAWLTRSNDGFTRERALRALLREPEPWHVPFVVQLCGEYVVSVAQLVAEFASRLAQQPDDILDSYRTFWAANPQFIELTRARAASYWNAYYRGEWTPARYPARVALDTIAVAVH